MTARILTPAEASAIQAALNEVAHAQLMVDGHFGALSQQAVMRFQADHNISPADGNPSQPTLDALGIPNLFAPPVKPHLTPNPVVQAIGLFALKLVLNKLKGDFPMFAFLDGYKTYIVGAVAIITGLISMIGWSVPGLPAISPAEGWQLVLGGFGAFGIRRALTTTATK